LVKTYILWRIEEGSKDHRRGEELKQIKRKFNVNQNLRRERTLIWGEREGKTKVNIMRHENRKTRKRQSAGFKRIIKPADALEHASHCQSTRKRGTSQEDERMKSEKGWVRSDRFPSGPDEFKISPFGKRGGIKKQWCGLDGSVSLAGG